MALRYLLVLTVVFGLFQYGLALLVSPNCGVPGSQPDGAGRVEVLPEIPEVRHRQLPERRCCIWVGDQNQTCKCKEHEKQLVYCLPVEDTLR